MEVGVKVWVENYLEVTRRHVSSAYVTFVAVDRQGKSILVPEVVPETEDEKRRFDEASRRRELRHIATGHKRAART
jgi:acyl-CoA hydrolase